MKETRMKEPLEVFEAFHKKHQSVPVSKITRRKKPMTLEEFEIFKLCVVLSNQKNYPLMALYLDAVMRKSELHINSREFINNVLRTPAGTKYTHDELKEIMFIAYQYAIGQDDKLHEILKRYFTLTECNLKK